MRKKFGGKVRKIPVNAGFACPNKEDRAVGGGCIFCDSYGSGPIKSYDLSIPEQIENFLAGRRGEKYIAYYQAHSNTYAPVSELRRKYELVFNYKEIVGLFIGTRPDAIAEEAYPLLEQLNKRIYLSVELGLQTIHPAGLRYLHRNHTYEQFLDTFHKLKERGIDVVVHLIIGIPGETKEQMLETVKEMNRIKPAGIKFHLLHVLKGTLLLEAYKKKEFKLLEKEEYIELIIFLLEHLDPGIVIHRLTGERDREIFYAPAWALNKVEAINAIRSKMKERSTFQGRLC
ncbi:MAG: TIGR01212 family radical SAM protein [Candidatus Aminicenantes bacterium]|nr:TIGR01212 family radical SAM protein [Candidatus Aminicenantes bacterium]